MKKLLSTLLLAAAVPATMLAKPLNGELLKMNQIKVTPDVKSTFLKADSRINPAILAEEPGRTVTMDTIPLHGRWDFFTGSSFGTDGRAIYYDEYSNTVYVLHNFFQVKGTNVPETNGKLKLITYNQGGTVKGESISLYEGTAQFLYQTRFDMSNPSKSTNPLDINVVATANDFYDHSTTDLINKDSVAFCLYDAAKLVAGEPTKKVVFETGPSASKVYLWRDLNPKSYVSADNSNYYIAGASLFAAEGSGAMSGKYGFNVLDNSNGHSIEYSDFPSQFGLDKFSDPKPTGHFNSPVFFGQDKNKKLYAFVNNMHRVDLTKRLPAISVSNDDGVSWSELEIMPWSVVDNYVKPYVTDGTPTEDLDLGFQVYNGTDFLMQENGDFSYVAKLVARQKESKELFVTDIVEVYKESGVWGMRKVEDMKTRKEDNTFTYLSLLSIFEAGIDPVKGKMAYDVHDRANELELGITKDKQYLVMKWIDYKFTYDDKGEKVYAEGDESVTAKLWYQTDSEKNTWEESDFTGFQPTAIYVKYRKIGTSEWSKPVQLTNDERYHMHTHMPDVIPSLENIPMVTTLANRSKTNLTDWPATFLPDKLKDLLGYELRTPIYNVFNAGKLAVNDTPTSKDAISVYPNPANNTLTVSCEANSTVEIFNTLGEKMMDVKGNNANVSSLANGIYLVKVTKDGKVSSTLFTVAK